MFELHPILSLFFKFDIELKRMIRLMFICYQISAIAIISGIVFGTTYRESDRSVGDRKESPDEVDKQNAVIVGFILAVLTLPTFERVVECFKSRLVNELNYCG